MVENICFGLTWQNSKKSGNIYFVCNTKLWVSYSKFEKFPPEHDDAIIFTTGQLLHLIYVKI